MIISKAFALFLIGYASFLSGLPIKDRNLPDIRYPTEIEQKNLVDNKWKMFTAHGEDISKPYIVVSKGLSDEYLDCGLAHELVHILEIQNGIENNSCYDFEKPAYQVEIQCYRQIFHDNKTADWFQKNRINNHHFC